jgi:hypothetical protein
VRDRYKKVCSESYHKVDSTTINYLKKKYVSLSLQMEGMERLINGEDLDSELKSRYIYVSDIVHICH